MTITETEHPPHFGWTNEMKGARLLEVNTINAPQQPGILQTFKVIDFF